MNNNKRKISVSELREFKFCSVSWCIARNLGEQVRVDLSTGEKKELKKGLKLSEKQMDRGETAHFWFDFKRVAGIILFLIISGLGLWILLSYI